METVELEVLGQKYTVKAPHDKHYIERVEQCLNEKIQEVREAGGAVTTFNIMVLVALNLVDECFKKEEELNTLTQAIEENAAYLVNRIEEYI